MNNFAFVDNLLALHPSLEILQVEGKGNQNFYNKKTKAQIRHPSKISQ
jgi:hypothetical protein